jgi:hypothetical protein
MACFAVDQASRLVGEGCGHESAGAKVPLEQWCQDHGDQARFATATAPKNQHTTKPTGKRDRPLLHLDVVPLTWRQGGSTLSFGLPCSFQFQCNESHWATLVTVQSGSVTQLLCKGCGPHVLGSTKISIVQQLHTDVREISVIMRLLLRWNRSWHGQLLLPKTSQLCLLVLDSGMQDVLGRTVARTSARLKVELQLSHGVAKSSIHLAHIL